MAESWISVVRLSWHSGSIIEASWYYGKVDMGGMGSSTMELMGSVILLRVLRVPFLQNGQESLLFQVLGVLSSWE